MSKQKNQNIGHMKCYSCDELAAVRKDKNGSLYFICLECGKIAPNHAGGIRRIQERAVIWGAEGAPADVPTWIREQYPYALAIRERDKKKSQDDAGNATAPGGLKIVPEAPAAPPAAGAAAPDLPDAPTPPRKRAPKVPRENPRKTPPPARKETPPPEGEKGGDFWDDIGL